MRQNDSGNSYFFGYILVFCIGFFVFSPCLTDFFVSDDFIWIKEGANFSFSDLFEKDEIATYNIFRPLIPALFYILHKVFGLNPFPYHFISVLIHALNALLFYAILMHLWGNKAASLVSASLFAAHFAHEESVFWVSSLCVLGCWLFSLASVLVFLKWLRQRKTRFFLLSLGFASSALLIREDALVLPLILLLIIFIDFYNSSKGETNIVTGKLWPKVLVNLITFLAVDLLYLYLRSLALPNLSSSTLLSFSSSNLLINLVYQLANITFPIRFAFDFIGYHHSVSLNLTIQSIGSNATVILASGVLLTISVFCFFVWFRKTRRGIKLLIIIFLLSLLPLLFFRGYGLRFTYFPLLGFSPLAGYVLLSLARRVTITKVKLKRYCIHLSLLLVTVINFLVLCERHLWWASASSTCKETISRAEIVVSSVPVGSVVCFDNLPTRVHGAYIFKNGFDDAIGLFFPQNKHTIFDSRARCPCVRENENLQDCYLFLYEDGRFRQVTGL